MICHLMKKNKKILKLKQRMRNWKHSLILKTKKEDSKRKMPQHQNKLNRNLKKQRKKHINIIIKVKIKVIEVVVENKEEEERIIRKMKQGNLKK